MDRQFDIQQYMTRGVERIVTDALRATMKNPRESAYMLRFAAASKKASKKRAVAEKAGEHIPPFLIASITSSCNLHCAGCYSRCNEATTDHKPVDQLSGEEWNRIFDEAEEMGVSFILLAGRGFFHINSHGGAEPCPFSPYSDVNVRNTSLKEAVHSKLFRLLREKDILADDHKGGCTLFAKRELVEAQLASLGD